jgi:hypothetical protein
MKNYLLLFLLFYFGRSGFAQSPSSVSIRGTTLTPQTLTLTSGTTVVTGTMAANIQTMDIVVYTGTLSLSLGGTAQFTAGTSTATYGKTYTPNFLPAVPYTLATSSTAVIILNR